MYLAASVIDTTETRRKVFSGPIAGKDCRTDELGGSDMAQLIRTQVVSDRSSASSYHPEIEWLQRENRIARSLEGIVGIIFIVAVILAIALFVLIRMPARSLPLQ